MREASGFGFAVIDGSAESSGGVCACATRAPTTTEAAKTIARKIMRIPQTQRKCYRRPMAHATLIGANRDASIQDQFGSFQSYFTWKAADAYGRSIFLARIEGEATNPVGRGRDEL